MSPSVPREPGRGRRSVLVTLLAIGLVLLAGIGSAHAALSIETFNTSVHDPAGAPVSQAGAHADYTVEFTVGRVTHGPNVLPAASLRDVEITLPEGMYANLQNTALCPVSELSGVILGDGCSTNTQVGWLVVSFGEGGGAADSPSPVFQMTRQEGDLATLAAVPSGTPVEIGIRLKQTASGYRLVAFVKGINQGLSVWRVRMTMWGNPSDPAHNAERVVPGYDGPSRPYMAMPARCDAPLRTEIRANSWQEPNRWVSSSTESPALTGCDALSFGSTLDMRPTTTQADTPSGYGVTMRIPQDVRLHGLATPQLRKAVVTLPEGVAISPSSASGLEGCTDAQMAPENDAEPACPSAANIGTVSITSPVLDEPLAGEIVLGSPKPGNLFRIWIVARTDGALLKLPGIITPDKQTGRLTATFDNTPQLPFDELKMMFKDGPRAPLANPQTCGSKTTSAELTPHTGAAVTATSSFAITGCTGGFAPTFEAGTLNPLAGALSPFTMTIRRADGQQDIGGLSLDMPSGLLASIRGIPQCPEAQAAAGTCDESSRIGTTTVEAGPGSAPFPLQGKVFLGGPYKGAPFSLSVVVHALAGPYDLGLVVVRAPIHVDAATAKLAVASDPLPTILEGVPLRLRTINISMDRPGFMFNATSCKPQQIGARISSTAGAIAAPSVPYQAQGCSALPLRPNLSLTLSGQKETTDGKHPGIRATMTQGRGESGLKKVAVKLPLSLALDPDNAQALCKPEQAAARACPAGSIIGRATAVTPALNRPLSGPIYFVENTRRTASGAIRKTLPKLWLKLDGEVPLDLYAPSSVSQDHLVTTFDMIPDAPISRFDLEIYGGKNGVIVANTDICAERQLTSVTFDGQNGKRTRSKIRMGLPCGFKVSKRSAKGRSYELTLSGLKAGKVRISGKGIKTATRTVKRASVVRMMAVPTTASRRKLARGGSVATRVTVSFTPTGAKKARTVKTKLTYRG